MSNTTALVPQKQQVANLRSMLERSKDQIALALPRHMTPERMIRVAITAIQKTPKLLECDQLSIVGSIITASQLGLEPHDILGQAYLVPFWNGKTRRLECQLQAGYRGLIALARRSGEVSALYSELVYKTDKIKIVKGDTPSLIHEPNYFSEDRGEIIGAYAVVVYKDGSKDWEFMPMLELNKIRATSKAKDKDGNEYGPWTTHPEEMYRKCPIRRLAKRLPLSPEFVKAAVLDEYADAGISQHLESEIDSASEAARVATESRTEQIAAKYAQSREQETSQQPEHGDGWEPTDEENPSQASEIPQAQAPAQNPEPSHRTRRPSGRNGDKLPGTPLSFGDGRDS